MFRKILPIILSFFIIYTPFFAFAATAPGGGGRWTDKTVTRVGLDDIIEATARQQTIRNGSSVTLEAVVRETVNRRAVGKVLLSRLLAGGVLVGATQSLLDGIGWVMEDGVYVKYKKPDSCTSATATKESCDSQFLFSASYNAAQAIDKPSPESACSYLMNDSVAIKTFTSSTPVSRGFDNLGYPLYSCVLPIKTGGTYTVHVGTKKNPNYKGQEPKPQRIVLTEDMMGDIAVGDYTDPVSSSKDKKDRVWTGVEEAYQNDPSGTGNELSDALDDKMDNAPEKPTKPTIPPDTDGEGQKYPTDKDKGTEGTTDQDKDPTTGEPTGSGSFNLPAWCLWAADQCQWHKEDKQHQTEEKTVWEDQKKHRADEKTFWQTVKDWFTWTKDDSDLPERDDSDLNTTVDFEEKKIGLNVSPQCPAPTFETITLHGVTAQVKTSDYTYICQLDWLIKPFTIGFASVLACFILFGFNRGSED